MASVSNLLHRTPWWGLLGGGLAIFVVLALFTTPFHLMRLEKSGATPAENRAIKSEINAAFSEGAIDIARSVVREMRNNTKDPEARRELDNALQEIERAREELRQQTREAERERRQAAVEATRDAARAIQEAQEQTARALRDAGVDNERVNRALEKSLEEARKAEQQARTQTDKAAPPPLPPIASAGPAVQLPPELRQEIRDRISRDLFHIGLGSAMILVFIPLFILAVISKVLIDRSRAAQRVAEVKRKEADYHRMSQQVTEAKLSALQAQVEPHFLYNTLASVQALTEVDPQKASEMTAHLIQYLRNALPKMRDSVSTVGQEVELVRAYLNILQMRMGKRLAFEIDVPPELMEAPFPPLMLPSLVENAIKHGLEPQREGGTVRISAQADGEAIRMTVADTGRGFGETVGTGVGLTNIRERLAALYGDAGKLTLEANEPQGVKAIIEVPRVRQAAAQPSGAPPAAQPARPATETTMAWRTLSAMGTAERAWRKGVSFAFIVLTVIAAVLAGLAVVGIATGLMPVQIGSESVGGASGALIGTAVIALAFAVVVVALAILCAVVYGLGFLFVGLAIFIPLVILVSLFPVLAPFILVGLGIWWLIRRSGQAT